MSKYEKFVDEVDKRSFVSLMLLLFIDYLSWV